MGINIRIFACFKIFRCITLYAGPDHIAPSSVIAGTYGTVRLYDLLDPSYLQQFRLECNSLIGDTSNAE